MIGNTHNGLIPRLERLIADNPVKLLTLSYTLALTLIALMTVQVHFSITGVIAKNENSGHVINVAGRQRMMSQRIAMLLMETVDTPSKQLKNQLTLAINSMETAHQALTQGSAALRIRTPLSPELQQHYFSPPHNLDERVRLFIRDARTITNAIDNNISHEHFIDMPEFQRVQSAARNSLLNELDRAVKLYDAEALSMVGNLYDSQEIALGVILAALLLEALLIFRPMAKKVATHTRLVEKIANEDHLTGVYNRGAFMSHASIELKRARRHQTEATLLLFDLDHFKSINDTYGHPSGDLVLQNFASLVESNIRKEDIFGRFGGEEFVLLLPQTSIQGAHRVAQKILELVSAHELLIANTNQTIHFTTSIGITSLSSTGDTLDKMLERADQALYTAKTTGRNRFVTSYAEQNDRTPPSTERHVNWHI